jgi:prepilin-type N-terminal cleavage/methylation domain-containing protein/prepilin-type processing-associated H-X9-DG protein
MYVSGSQRVRGGFTLIELLSVLAIIGILSSLLFPVFTQAREKARSVTCLSNQKQIGTAMMMYAQDYDEGVLAWLRARGYPEEPATQRVWTATLQPYLKVSQDSTVPRGVLACPSWDEARFLKTAPACNDGLDVYGQFFPLVIRFSDYGVTFQMYTVDGAGTKDDPYYQYAGSYVATPNEGGKTTYLPEVVRPAETAILSDGVTGFSGTFVFLAKGCEAQDRHQGGGNHIFLDGHARWIKGNSEGKDYLAQDEQGNYYLKYWTYSR